MSIYHYFDMQVILVDVFFNLISIDKYTQAQVSVVPLFGILKWLVLSGPNSSTICFLRVYDGFILYFEEKGKERC